MPGTFLAAAVLVTSLLSPAAVHLDVPFALTDGEASIAEPQGIGSPGSGLGLATREPVRPVRSPLRVPFVPAGGAGLGGALITTAILARRRRAGAAGVSQEPLFVYVPGHGGDPKGFEDLAGRMGIASDDVRVFDYRWARPSIDQVEASKRVPAADAADALDAYLAALGSNGRPIYLVGHSKGGAVITEVVARWDAQPGTGVDAVAGATILDPPIARGPLGVLQSLGWFHGDTADDGLFDPVRCRWNGCRDIRDRLGERSGVEVVIVRNPDAVFTNFRDRPDRVRVYDLDDGGGSMIRRFPSLVGMWQRMGEAHNSVLHNDTVADCIAAEARETGSCVWPKPRKIVSLWDLRRLVSRPLVY